AEYHPDQDTWNGKIVVDDPTWIEARSMLDALWATPQEIEPLEVPLPNEVDPALEFWWMLGRWVGDGWVGGAKAKGQVYICSGKHEADALHERLHSLSSKWRRSEEETTFRFRLADSDLADW